MKAALTALCTGFTAPLLAQGWVPPQPPCEISAAHFKLNAGLAAWQGGKEDSAVALFGLAARLAPGNPKAFVALAGLYAGKDNYDSALVYYRRTVEAAGNDTAFAKDKRDALSNVARLLV